MCNSPSGLQNTGIHVGYVVLIVGAISSGCRGVEAGPHWHFERMIVQPRADAYGASGVLPDGRVMQPPPEYTLDRGETAAGVFATGVGATGPVSTIPVPLSNAFMQRGRQQYDIACSPCHGIAGDAVSPIAFRMVLRHPRSLHEAEVRGLPPGRIFQVIREGYGFMPSYASMLTLEDSWAVVAYVRALQLSQYAQLDSLPPNIRDLALQRLGAVVAPQQP